MSSIDNTLNLGAKLYNQLQLSKKEHTKSEPIMAILDFIKQNMMKGESREVLGLYRELKVNLLIKEQDADLYGRGYISPYDFAKILKRYRIGEEDIQDLIDAFNMKRDQISYELFMNTLIENKNESRKQLVKNIFINDLDRSRTGYLAVSILKSFYNAKNHPDVRTGTITEKEALREFTETLELYIGKAQKITKEEFMKYYEYVSFCVPNDKRFESLLSVWSRPKDEYEQPRKPRHYTPYNVAEVPIVHEKHAPPKFDRELIDLVKENILTKGVRCLFGIYRGFSVFSLVKLNRWRM